MNDKVPAAREAETWLKWAETGYGATYQTVPLEVRLEIGRAWIELARIEADIAIARINSGAEKNREQGLHNPAPPGTVETTATEQ